MKPPTSLKNNHQPLFFVVWTQVCVAKLLPLLSAADQLMFLICRRSAAGFGSPERNRKHVEHVQSIIQTTIDSFPCCVCRCSSGCADGCDLGDLVCGDDGITYQGSCLAICQGVAIVKQGACTPTDSTMFSSEGFGTASASDGSGVVTQEQMNR